MQSRRSKDIFRKIIWPGHKVVVDEEFFQFCQPTRTVSSHPRYISGEFWSDKCCRNIQFESALELEFIKRIEGDKRVTRYCEQPMRIHYWRGKHKQTYTPDFIILLSSGLVVVAEVKCLAEMLSYRVQAKTEGLLEYCHEHGFGMLLTDGTHTPDHLLKGKINRKLEGMLKSATSTGPIRRDTWKEIKESSAAVDSQLYRAVIRLDLKFHPFPFKIQRGNQNEVFRKIFFEKKKYEELAHFTLPEWIQNGIKNYS